MKVKIRNVLILLLGILVFGTILCSNQVNATEITIEQAQAMLDLIPNEIALDIPEIDVDKTGEKLKIEAEKIWKGNNINTEEIDIQYYDSLYYLGKEYLYVATINIKGYLSKDIVIKYNNTDKWNEADEAYVKNLNIKPIEYTYYEWKIEDSLNEDRTFEEFVGDYYTNLINDESIVVKAKAGASGGDFLINGFERIYFSSFQKWRSI